MTTKEPARLAPRTTKIATRCPTAFIVIPLSFVILSAAKDLALMTTKSTQPVRETY